MFSSTISGNAECLKPASEYGYCALNLLVQTETIFKSTLPALNQFSINTCKEDLH